jgi:hypothetical protein
MTYKNLEMQGNTYMSGGGGHPEKEMLKHIGRDNVSEGTSACRIM